MSESLRLSLLIVFSVCLLASGFLSGSETALTAVPRERIQQLRGNGRRGRRLAALASDLEGTIGTILVANNFVNILATSVAAAIAIDLVGETAGTIYSTVIVTVLVLVIGEVTPKTLAARRPEQYGLIAATPIWALKVILRPISRVFIGVGRGILAIFRVRAPDGPGVTGADIRALALLGEHAGEIDAGEREIIERLFETADQPVREAMTPRVDIVTLTAPVSAAAVRAAVAETAHSRFLVVNEEGNLDSLRGVLHAKDVLLHGHDLESKEIMTLLRDPFYVPESSAVMRVLQDLRARKASMAVIMDEHGGVDGVVTIKDLVGELVGELQDEYDPRIPVIAPVGADTWIADGRTPIDEVEEVLEVEVGDGPYTTLAGYYLFLAGSIPSAGDHQATDELEFTVRNMDRRRIDKLVVHRITPGISSSRAQ